MAKMITKLSLSSLNQLINKLELKEKQYSQIAKKIADRLADELLEYVMRNGYSKYSANNPYSNSKKNATKVEGKVATGSVVNNDLMAVFYEFGTGVVGSQNPHINEILSEIGWKYDVNNHGEQGWWYPTTAEDTNPYKWTDESGQLRAWTRGLEAQKIFYEALQVANEKFIEIGKEELIKANK